VVRLGERGRAARLGMDAGRSRGVVAIRSDRATLLESRGAAGCLDRPGPRPDDGEPMARDSFVVVANEYRTEADALADYEDVRKRFADLGILGDFDAVVVTRRADGDVAIVKRVEEPTRHSARAGLAIGLAVGALTALLPAVGIGLALVAGGAIGAGVGAVAGHIAGGMSRSDLESLSELLDKGASGLLVVAATGFEDTVVGSITRANTQARADLHADLETLKHDLARAVV
jgi:uncharacterized membrane protein